MCDNFETIFQGGRPKKVEKHLGQHHKLQLRLEHCCAILCKRNKWDSTANYWKSWNVSSAIAFSTGQCSCLVKLLYVRTDWHKGLYRIKINLECPPRALCCMHTVLTDCETSSCYYISFLQDIILHCGSCNGDITAGLYSSHNCSIAADSALPVNNQLLCLHTQWLLPKQH